MLDNSRAKLDLAQRRFRTWLERANDLDCLTLFWAVQALQSGAEKIAQKYIRYPKEAAVRNISSPYAIHKWELETLITSLLVTPKDRLRIGRHHRTNIIEFQSIARQINLLRTIEDVEYVKFDANGDVMAELYRNCQRQFFWQRGYNSEQLYRYAYVYGQGESASFFERTTGISISDFILLSISLWHSSRQKPWMEAPDISALNLQPQALSKALKLQSITLDEARNKALEGNQRARSSRGGSLRTAYMPSVLRATPIIGCADSRVTYCAPLPGLIMHRATAGLYYDIRQGPQAILAEANARFEAYVCKLFKAYYPSIDAFKGPNYGPTKAAQKEAPDCLIKNEKDIMVAVECKATKLKFDAQFSDDPITAAQKNLEQIAKGIFQLWRFFSHARQGLYTLHRVHPNAYGIVLTMDAWMQMAERLRPFVLARAAEMADQDPDIIESDRRMVIFASIQELNETLAQTDLSDFLIVLDKATTEKFSGYSLPSIARELPTKQTPKSFPMNMADVLPWWNRFKNFDNQQHLKNN